MQTPHQGNLNFDSEMDSLFNKLNDTDASAGRMTVTNTSFYNSMRFDLKTSLNYSKSALKPVMGSRLETLRNKILKDDDDVPQITEISDDDSNDHILESTKREPFSKQVEDLSMLMNKNRNEELNQDNLRLKHFYSAVDNSRKTLIY